MESSNVRTGVNEKINVSVNSQPRQNKTALDVGPSVNLVETTLDHAV